MTDIPQDSVDVKYLEEVAKALEPIFGPELSMSRYYQMDGRMSRDYTIIAMNTAPSLGIDLSLETAGPFFSANYRGFGKVEDFAISKVYGLEAFMKDLKEKLAKVKTKDPTLKINVGG